MNDDHSYVEFVIISKEISTLENEMLELKESLAEWKSMPSVLHIDEAASAAGMSVCNLKRYDMLTWYLQTGDATFAHLLRTCAYYMRIRCRLCTLKSRALPSSSQQHLVDMSWPRWITLCR